MRRGRWSCVALVSIAFVLLAPAGSVGASRAQTGLYIAINDSLTAKGASDVFKAWVQLYYGYLESNGSGVTELFSLVSPDATSTELRTQQLQPAIDAINSPSDTKVVTLDVGLNDIQLASNDCPTVTASTCPFEGNFTAILSAINAALANDPGDELVQVLEYYNPDIGRPREGATRQLLLGSDGKVDCSGTGEDVGLNDLIHCISIDQGAKPINLLPIFDAARQAFLSSDLFHPNDAGHLAIARAFGGAATPTTAPAGTPPTLAASKPKLSGARAGRPLTASMIVTNADTGETVSGQVTCRGNLSGKAVRAKRRSSSSSGKASCTWQIPAAAHKKRFTGTITLTFERSNVSRSFSTTVK